VPTRPKQLSVAGRQLPAKLAEVYVAVTDRGDGEDIFTVNVGREGQRLPIVAIDQRGLSVLRRYCQQLADETGQSVSIICFTSRRLYESLAPVTTGD
jgi:hypothetical protein